MGAFDLFFDDHKSLAGPRGDAAASRDDTPARHARQGSSSGPLKAGQQAKVVGKLMHLKVMASGWAIGRITTDEFGDLGVKGNPIAGLTVKQVYEFAGRVQDHQTYGIQIDIESVGLHVPANAKGIEKFLTQNYKGIGKKAAEKIVNFFSNQPGGVESLRSQLLANPYAMDFSQAGVKRKTKMDTVDGLKSLIYMDLATRIGGVELGDKLLRKIAGYLEPKVLNSGSPIEKAWAILTENPYAPIRDLDGYAFKTADVIARKVGFDLSRPERVAALVTHAINEGCNSGGHVFLTRADFHKIIKAIDPGVDVNAALDAAATMDEPMVIDHDRYYTEQNYKNERYLAKNLLERYIRPLKSRIHPGDPSEVQQEVEDAKKAVGIPLDESQVKAVLGLLTSTSPLHTVTAGPGCGKTTIMEVVVQIMRSKTRRVRNPESGELEDKPYKIAFCAPTGKAAKVLNGRIARYGFKATTIHALLGVRGGGQDDGGAEEGGDGPRSMFMHNHFNQLDVDLLVVDETSMVDLALMFALLQAVPMSAHIVLLGDTNQLPSVGPGDVLANILQMPFDHHRLFKTHRNSGGILRLVYAVGAGKVVTENLDGVTFIDGLPPATEESVSAVLQHYDNALDENFGDFSCVGLLIARRKGDPHNPGWNSTYLNAVLRERYNPERNRQSGSAAYVDGLAKANKGEKVYGTRMRVGDRVIIRKNLTIDEDATTAQEADAVVNGDTGAIIDYWMGGGNLRYILIKLDDERLVYLPAGEADVLDHAYAMTVHTAQGSEYKRIIYISVNGHSSFVHRGIVFTAFSRPKHHLTVVGNHDDLVQIVARPAPPRNSKLVERLTWMIQRQRERASASSAH